MKKPFVERLTLVLVGAVALSCGDDPAGPESGVNPGLLEFENEAGLAAASTDELPQGAATFEGPGGTPMDAAGEEFIQQLTLQDGTVLQTSGVYVKAVPDESVASVPFDRVSFGSAATGSLESVPPGTRAIGPWPEDVDFQRRIDVTYATVREELGREYVRASGGEVTFHSLDYFDDVYSCTISGPLLTVDTCEYQLGLAQGVVEFTATLSDGTVIVQDRTAFTVPIRRRTIVARLNR